MRMNQLRFALNRYRAAWLALLSLKFLILWPDALSPLAQAYIRFCAAVFADTLLFHHYPPYLVALLLLIVPMMILSTLFLLIRQLVGQRRLEADIARRRWNIDDWLSDVASASGLSRRFVVVDDPRVHAFCAGLISPKVYVSSGLLRTISRDEVAAVLLHEAHHLRQRDPFRLIIADIVHYLVAPFPAFRTIIIRARIRIELAADDAALERVPADVLASALLKVARAGSSFSPRASVAGLTPTEARVAALLSKPIAVPFDRRDLIMTTAVLLALGVAVGYLVTLPFPMNPLCDACQPY